MTSETNEELLAMVDLPNFEVEKYAQFELNTSKKEESQILFLRMVIAANPLFDHWDSELINNFSSKFFQVQFEAHEIAISEGDRAEFFFIVETGRFAVFQKNTDSYFYKRDDKLRGHCFGETALISHSTRNATVICVDPACAWLVKRKIFQEYVSQLGTLQSLKAAKMLDKIPLLQLLSPKERSSAASILGVNIFCPNSRIFEQDATNDALHIVWSGEAIASHELDYRSQEIARLRPGDYFGERALINTERVPASLIACGRVLMIVLSRKAFVSQFGTIDFLKSRAIKDKLTKY